MELQSGPEQTSPAPVTVVVLEQKPPDHVLWSLLNTVFLNTFGLGFIALIHSIKSRDCKVVHDLPGAAEFGRKARMFNIWALVVGLIALITKIVLVAVFASNSAIKVRSFEETLNQLRARLF